jgi:ABC-type nitrate/sulfonate/bicarbonate transport system substrate-binding protein
MLSNCKAGFQETTAIIRQAKRIAQAAIQARDASRAIYNESLGGVVGEAHLEQAIISAATEPKEQCDKELDEAWKQFAAHWYAILNANSIAQ